MTKLAFSGSHGTGKTFSAYTKVSELKLIHPNKSVCILNELARECPLVINKGTTEESQLWMFCSQISKEIEMVNKYDIVVCDRTVLECVAYCDFFGFDDLVKYLKPLAFKHLITYDQIYFNQIKNNQYNVQDGVRDNDELFRTDIEQILLKYYDEIYRKINLRIIMN